MKFGRSYEMMVTGVSGNPIYLAFPLTLEFSITHNIWATANAADFSLYNLSASHRREIYFNQYLKPQPYKIELNAGYVSQISSGFRGIPSSLPRIFNGYANIAYTEKSNSDLITRINALDNGDITSGKPAGYFDGTVEAGYTAPVGTTFKNMVKTVMRKLTNVTVGQILIDSAQLPGPISGKPRPFIGTAWEILQELASSAGGADVFIENGVCHMLSQNKTLGSNNLGVLQSSTGLLGIPRYTGATVMCSCIFEPSLEIGKSIELKSQGNPLANGLKKIVGYTHRGTISGVVSGEVVSDIVLSSVDAELTVTP